MTDSVRVFVHGDPKPKGSKRAFVVKGKPVLVESSKGAGSWQYLMAETLHAHSHHSWPWEGAVEVSLTYHLRRPKGVSVKKRPWPCVRPDIDKLERTVLDALVTAGAIRDDGQVCSVSHQKIYAPIPGVEIEVRKLSGQ